VIATKCHEVALSGVLIALQAPRHDVSVACANSALKAKAVFRASCVSKWD
jgi:hypothetical protein